MTWWQLLIVAGVGLVMGWLSGLPYRTDDPKKGSRLIINLVIGAAGGLLGGFLFFVMQNLLQGITGYIIMAVIGAIILLWLLARVKKGDSSKAE